MKLTDFCCRKSRLPSSTTQHGVRRLDMPFTPFHLGPAALLKGMLGTRFSFVVFGGSQILVDLEPLVQIFRGAEILHGPTHTIAGAVLIGFVSMLLGKPIGQLFLRIIKNPEPTISWGASTSGAFIGTFSHLILDGFMHSDMSPWAPLTSTNHLLGLISLSELHYFCLISGVVGLLIMGIKQYVQTDA